MGTWTYEVASEFSQVGRIALDYQGAKSYKLPEDDIARQEVTSDPYWALAIIRLGMPVSYDRDKMQSRANGADGAHVRGAMLLVTEDCDSLTITRSKGEHTKSLTASLLPNQSLNYLAEILPNDWVFAWMVNGQEKFNELLAKITKMDVNNPPNEFLDGLKFMGRVQSIRKRRTLSPSIATKAVVYNLQATAFKELDSSFFYDNNLSEHDIETNNLGNWMAKIGLGVDKLFSDQANPENGNINALIPTLLDLMVGTGISSNVNPTGNAALQAATGAVQNREAPYAYLVPRQVGLLLGRDEVSKPGGIMSYADLIETLMGIQNYSQPGFVPDLDEGKSTDKRHFTTKPMLGTFMPMMPDFSNRPCWEVLQQFLNPTINEMYTCMKLNAHGAVVPTIVVRQLPFSTDAFTGKIRVLRSSQPSSGVDAISGGSESVGRVTVEDSGLPHTKYLDLPRWKLTPSVVLDEDIGRSDATRFNFVHVYGQDALNIKNVSITDQLVENPPVRDDLDIQRSGLRPYMSTVACAVKDEIGNVPARWISLISDWSLGGHLTLNGTLTCVGIMAPICEGDNVEWEQVVYHIEGIVDTATIDNEGRKSWTTMLSLSNGMLAERTLGKSYPGYPSMKFKDTDKPTDSTEGDPMTGTDGWFTNGLLGKPDNNDMSEG